MTTKVSQCLISFFFFFLLYAHSCNSISMYSLNVLISFIQQSTLRLFWHCFLSIHFESHPTLSLSHGRRHMLWRPDTCQNVFTDIEKTDQIVFMGWYSMVYYLSNTVCVFYFPRSRWGWLAGVFIKMPESLRCRYEISITLANLTFFLSLLSVRTFWSVFGYVFTVLLRVALQAFSWDTTSLEVCFWKILGLKNYLKTFSLLI